MRISFLKDIQTKTVGDGKATSANGTNRTGLAFFCSAPGTIAPGYLGVIDLGDTPLEDIAD